MSNKPAVQIPRWRAFDRSGVGHAFLTRASRTSVCGKVRRPPDETRDWNRKSKCAACVAALEKAAAR